MAIEGTPVNVVTSGGFPIKQVSSAAGIPLPFFTVVSGIDAMPATLSENGLPVILLDTGGNDTGGFSSGFSDGFL